MLRTPRSSRRALLAASAAAFACPGAALAAEAARPEAVTVGEVVVTANKREQVLREVAQSVSVVGGETLERQQADNFQEYMSLVPGLSMTQTERGGATLVLRGINAGGVASTVAVYVDETPFGSSSGLANASVLAGDFDTFDVARLEVLRGPQGTLYGASSLGGVLKFVTNPPDPSRAALRAQAGVESVKGGELGWFATGVVNQPLGDKLAARVSGYYRRDGGFIDSIGTAGSLLLDDANSSEVYGGRASLLFEPTEAVSLRLTAVLQDARNDASTYYEADPLTYKPLYGRLSYSQYYPEFTDAKYRVYNATLTWDLGFASLLSTTSYGKLDQDYLLENTATVIGEGVTYGSFLTDAFGAPDRPLGSFLPNSVDQRKFTQEVRLSSGADGPFEWLVGFYYTREKGLLDQGFQAFELNTLQLRTDLPLLYEAEVKSRFQEYAGFASATWRITPRLELSFGGRLSRNKQRATQRLDGELIGGLIAYQDAQSSESVFTYSVAPRFELSDTASIYARVAKGYRPGGPNVLPPGAPPGTPGSYEADSLISYEAGFKADLWDRKVSVDVSAFYLDWKDVQVFAFVNDIGINANGGKAKSKGVELTVTARPVEGLSLLASGAYTDAELKDDTPDVVGGRKGDPLPYTPEWSLTLSGDYEWPIFQEATAFVGATLAMVGEQPGDFDPDFTATYGRRLRLDSYERLDLRAGVRRGGWALEAYVKNLTNARGMTYAGSQGAFPNGALGISIIRPRTVGLALTSSF